MGTQIHELQEQVEIRDNTIEVLENQLHDLQLELDDAKAHQNAPLGAAGRLVGGRGCGNRGRGRPRVDGGSLQLGHRELILL